VSQSKMTNESLYMHSFQNIKTQLDWLAKTRPTVMLNGLI